MGNELRTDTQIRERWTTSLGPELTLSSVFTDAQKEAMIDLHWRQARGEACDQEWIVGAEQHNLTIRWFKKIARRYALNQ